MSVPSAKACDSCFTRCRGCSQQDPELSAIPASLTFALHHCDTTDHGGIWDGEAVHGPVLLTTKPRLVWAAAYLSARDALAA